MKINSINSISKNLNINFKGAKKPEGKEDKPENKSLQNNSPEIYLPPETYMGMLGLGVMSDLEKKGAFDEAEEGKFPFSPFGGEGFPDFGDEDDIDEDGIDSIGAFFNNDKMAESAAAVAVDSLIYSMQFAMDGLFAVPEDKKGKIPVIYQITTEDFIKSIEDGIEEMENADYSGLPTDLSEIEEGEWAANLSEEEKESVMSIMQDSINLAQDENFIEGFAKTQRAMVDMMRTDKYEDVNKAITSLSEGVNYLMYKAINAGLDRNPRGVINNLTGDIMTHGIRRSKDLDDGTTEQTYNEGFSELKVLRRTDNGDFISADCTKNGEKIMHADFREDGSIKNLEYLNSIAKTHIAVKTSKNKARVLQYNKNGAVQRDFERKENGDLAMLNMRMLLPGKI